MSLLMAVSLCRGTLLPSHQTNPAASPAGSAPCGPLFRHVLVPDSPPPLQPLELLRRGHAKFPLNQGKGITVRFRPPKGICSEAVGRPDVGAPAPSGQSTPVLSLLGETTADVSSLELWVCSVTVRAQWNRPLLLAPGRAPPCTRVLGHVWLECPGVQTHAGQRQRETLRGTAPGP